MADLTQGWGEWEFNAAVQRMSVFYSEFPTGQTFQPIGDFTRLDLSASRRLRVGGQTVTLTQHGRKVTNSHYRTQVGYADPDAIWGASGQIEF